MYKVLIIDDEFQAQEGLKVLLNVILPELLSPILVANSISQSIEIIKQNKPDLVFLDINLQNGFGYELFDHFSETDFEVIITTANSDYILEALNNWGCLGYLTKPLDYDILERLLYRFKNRLKSSNDQYENTISRTISADYTENKLLLNQQNGVLLFSSLNEIYFIKIDEIVYCKADDNYCEIFTPSKIYTITKSLKEVEKAIGRKTFARLHRSYLVNLNFATRLDKKLNLIVLQSKCGLDKEISLPVTASGVKILNGLLS